MKKRDTDGPSRRGPYADCGGRPRLRPGRKPPSDENHQHRWTFNYFPQEEEVRGVYESPRSMTRPGVTSASPTRGRPTKPRANCIPTSATSPPFDNPYWWNGWGWYRKRIDIGREYAGRRIRFEFDGVQKYAKIYLNGKYLGDHKGRLHEFYVDATDAVNFRRREHPGRGRAKTRSTTNTASRR